MAINTTTVLTNGLPTILDEFKYTLLHKDVGRQLVTVVKLKKHTGTAYNIYKYSNLTAYALVEGIDMTQAQSLADSTVAITPGEYGVQVVITDMSEDLLQDASVIRRAGKLLGMAVSKKEDEDVVTLFDSFTTNTPLGSGSGTNLSAALVSAAFATITGNSTEPAPGPYNSAFHPYSIEDLSQTIAVTGTYPVPTGISQDVLENYYVNRVSQCHVFSAGNLTVASNAAKGGVFSKEAIYLVDFKPSYAEDERDSSLRGVELNMVQVRGQGIATNAFGIEMNVAASVPA